MGHGIAQVTAMAGNEVTIRDIDEEVLADGVDSIEANLQGGVDRGKVTEAEMTATLDHISTTTDLEAAVGDAELVVEAVPEDVGLKQSVFEDVEAAAPADAIIATNTSSLSVTEIVSTLDDSGRALGLHFFNPVHIMGLVEVIRAEQTDQATLDRITQFVESLDKTPITIRDSAGFASSRLGVALGAEAIRMLETGVASPRDIDQAMELGYNHPMGPIELTDVVGLDVRLDVLEYLREELGERFRPPQALRRKVRAGKLGKKSGEGFYVWEDGEIVGVSGEGDIDDV
ncbi:3-hydroxyacyl-CoA dehydrogenase [Halorubrum saccharovorum DSM 1137]|uniref:3-hydroxyacyl-CoA dehydrogenase n=2 Tax=Halorubrum saccharovorum TaxID=2248 RepID=M0DUC8_9EURY|nr:3-hydroxyacyl-CoA dehydrogenase [Halorubrum saccharovorum DSM 1137]